jgi:hypothetical protein
MPPNLPFFDHGAKVEGVLVHRLWPFAVAVFWLDTIFAAGSWLEERRRSGLSYSAIIQVDCIRSLMPPATTGSDAEIMHYIAFVPFQAVGQVDIENRAKPKRIPAVALIDKLYIAQHVGIQILGLAAS